MSVKNRFCLEMNGWCALVAHSRLWALDQEFQPPCLSLFPAGVDLRRSLLLFASALKPWLSRRHLSRSDIPRPTYHISHHSSSLLLRSSFFPTLGTRSPARRYCMKTEIEPAAEMRFPAVAPAAQSVRRMWAAAAPRPPDDAPPAPRRPLPRASTLARCPRPATRRPSKLGSADAPSRAMSRLGPNGLRRGEGFAGDGDGLE